MASSSWYGIPDVSQEIQDAYIELQNWWTSLTQAQRDKIPMNAQDFALSCKANGIEATIQDYKGKIGAGTEAGHGGDTPPATGAVKVTMNPYPTWRVPDKSGDTSKDRYWVFGAGQDNLWHLYDPLDPQGSDLSSTDIQKILDITNQQGGGDTTPDKLLPSGDNIFDITGAKPPPAYEYYYKKPEAAWQAQLTKGGLPTTGNYGNFLTGLQQNTYLNNLLTNLGSIAQGGQMSPYGTTAPEYNANPAAWKAFINAPSGTIPSDYLANPSQTGGAVYNMGLNTSKSQGLPLELLMFLAGQQGDMLNRYQAQGMNPSQNYGQYLNQYLGIR